jgi:hypothetical protein
MATKKVLPPASRKSSSDALGQTPEAGSFSRGLAIETVPETGLDMEVCASEAEGAALAKACGLVAVHAFEAGFHVRKLDRTSFNVTGRLRARVTQTCVVSLEPFETLIHADIDVDFAPLDIPFGQFDSRKILSGGGLAATFHGGGDPPDPIIDGKIDLGALAAEFLVLNLDVYPRKPGVSFNGTDVVGEASQDNSPFGVLRHRS